MVPNTNKFLIKTFLIAKFDCTSFKKTNPIPLGYPKLN